MIPPNLRVKTKDYQPKNPLDPTRHRKNHCSPNKDKTEENMPLRKSAPRKWSNNYSNYKKEKRTKIMELDRKRSEKLREKLTRSKSRKMKQLFYKDGSSHRSIQNSKFSPTFTNIDGKSAKPFTIDGENLIPAGEGDRLEVYDLGNSYMYQSFRENSPSRSVISKQLHSINIGKKFGGKNSTKKSNPGRSLILR
jgi:hypothetical protein